MGLIWNSPATQQMIDEINNDFSGDKKRKGKEGDRPPIRKWKRQKNKELFIAKHELCDIAADHYFFGGGSKNSTADIRWQTWLKLLGDSTQINSPHEVLRAAIYDAIDKKDDIVFTVIPWSQPFITIVPSDVGNTKSIEIYTPTVAAMKAALARRIAIRKKWRNRPR